MNSIRIIFKALTYDQPKIFELDENFNFKIEDNCIELSYAFPDGNLSAPFFLNMSGVTLNIFTDYVSVLLPVLDDWQRVYEYTESILAKVNE